MTIPEPPQSDAVPTTPYEAQTAVAPPVVKPSSALALTALIVGGVAFLSGLVPVWGLIVGAAAVVLGVFALLRKQRAVFALAGLGLGAVAGLTSLITTIVLISGLGNIREDTALIPMPTSTVSSAPAVEPTVAPKPTATPTPTPTVDAVPPKPVETVSQSNAVRKAQSYLAFTSFSRSGLVDQLVFEGFSLEDATYGTDAVGADWNQQAAAKAKSYLDLTAFSREGLIEQLVFEGFTAEEAEFGVTAVGL